jgi:hypothetical protein
MPRLRKVATALAAALSGALLVIIARVWGPLAVVEVIIVVAVFGLVYLRSGGVVKAISGFTGPRISASGMWWSNVRSGVEVISGVTDSLRSGFGIRIKEALPEEDENKIEALDKAIAKLSTGDVVVTAPKRMKVGDSREVTVTIATANHARFLANVDAADEKRLIDTTKVGNTMRVELVASKDAFDIVPIGQLERVFGGHETWLFEITAKSAGNHALKVMIAVVVQLAGRIQEHPYYLCAGQRSQYQGSHRLFSHLFEQRAVRVVVFRRDVDHIHPESRPGQGGRRRLDKSLYRRVSRLSFTDHEGIASRPA